MLTKVGTEATKQTENLLNTFEVQSQQKVANLIETAGNNLNLAIDKTQEKLKKASEDLIVSTSNNLSKNAPKIVVAVLVPTVLVTLAGVYGYKYIKKYSFEPSLIDKNSSINGSVGFIEYLQGHKKTALEHEMATNMVIDPRLKDQLDDLIFTTKNIKKNDGYFDNVILYGPPGTGKTLYAQLLARNSGMDAFIIPGPNISGLLANGTAIEQLNDLFDKAERKKNGTIIFFDEAETFLAQRSSLTLPAQNALNLFLSRTGTPSKKVMIICATNRPEIIDEAVQSRCGTKIHFDLPNPEQRTKILDLHIRKIFGNQKGTQVDYTVLKKEEMKEKIIAQLEGTSGRIIQKFANQLRQSALAQEKPIVTEALINRIIKEKIIPHGSQKNMYHANNTSNQQIIVTS